MSQKGLERTLSLLYKLYLFLNYFQPVTIVNVYTLHPGPVLINHVLESLVQRHFAISVLMRVKKSPRGVSYTGALCVVTQRSSLLLPLTCRHKERLWSRLCTLRPQCCVKREDHHTSENILSLFLRTKNIQANSREDCRQNSVGLFILPIGSPTP